MQQMQETWVQSLGWEDPLEEEMTTYSSILAWKNPMDRGIWQAIVHGVMKNQTWLSPCFCFAFLNWREIPQIQLLFPVSLKNWKNWKGFLQVLKFSEFNFPPKLEIVIPTWEGCWDDHVGTCTEKVHSNGLFQFSSVAQSCPTLCDPMNRSMPGLPVHHQLPKSTQTHVPWVGDAIQSSHPLSSPSPPALNLSQHQGLFQWVSSSHQVAKVLEFQLQHQSFQWIPRTNLL